MRKLALLIALAVGACIPPSTPWDPSDADSYYPPSMQYDTVVERVHLQYDTYRADKHGIPLSLAKTIRIAATAEGIPLGLAFSLIQVESAFTPRAVSHAGAVGLTQIMPRTGAEHCNLSRNELFTPELNIPCGFSYLSMLHDRLSVWDLALASYNVGDARRRRAHLTGEPDGSWYASLVLDLAS
jgi:soluble lytic murein transglycosylase-like protein